MKCLSTLENYRFQPVRRGSGVLNIAIYIASITFWAIFASFFSISHWLRYSAIFASACFNFSSNTWELSFSCCSKTKKNQKETHKTARCTVPAWCTQWARYTLHIYRHTNTIVLTLSVVSLLLWVSLNAWAAMDEFWDKRIPVTEEYFYREYFHQMLCTCTYLIFHVSKFFGQLFCFSSFLFNFWCQFSVLFR